MAVCWKGVSHKRQGKIIGYENISWIIHIRAQQKIASSKISKGPNEMVVWTSSTAVFCTPKSKTFSHCSTHNSLWNIIIILHGGRCSFQFQNSTNVFIPKKKLSVVIACFTCVFFHYFIIIFFRFHFFASYHNVNFVPLKECYRSLVGKVSMIIWINLEDEKWNISSQLHSMLFSFCFVSQIMWTGNKKTAQCSFNFWRF